MKIVHVTESMGGGVVSVLQVAIRAQIENKQDVTLLYCERSETPSAQELASLFPGTKLVCVPGSSSTIRLVHRLHRNLRRLASTETPDVVHLHSSYAGLAGRINRLQGVRYFYSPHCYAFLRTDLSKLTRWVTKLAEKLLSNKAVTIAVSESEMHAFRSLKSKRARARKVENRIDLANFPTSPLNFQNEFNVFGIGRGAHQKGFDRFNEIANAFVTNDQISFTWIGNADHRPASNVHVTGWLARAEVLSTFHDRSPKILLFTSRWEGLPMALIEALCSGTPVIYFDAPGVTGVAIKDLEGIEVRDKHDGINQLAQLVGDPSPLNEMSRNALNSQTRFDSASYWKELKAVYDEN